MTGRSAAAVTLLVAGLALTGCVGPARTTHTYESKAVRAANDSLSALQTALLCVRTSQRGRLTQPYLETVLSRSEDSFTSVQNTFDSIEPPDTARADRLRGALDQLLSDGSDGLAQLRILARRHDGAELGAEARRLMVTAVALNRFAQDHG
jgi:hypothetical protein